jgi:hypothetical protein
LCVQRSVEIDRGAKRVWRDDQYAVPFSRHYSPEVFAERVFSAVPQGVAASVVAFSNIEEVMASFPGQRVYCFFMFTLTRLPD